MYDNAMRSRYSVKKHNINSSPSGLTMCLGRHRAGKPRMLLELPQHILSEILLICFLSGNRSVFQTCGFFAFLGDPLILHTISIRTLGQLSELVSAPSSPIYDISRGTYICCLELAIAPQETDFVFPRHPRTLACPNLCSIRFKFNEGIRVNPFFSDRSDLLTRLANDTIERATRNGSNHWQRFLSQFDPVRFEWISPDRSEFHLVGLTGYLRGTFSAWSSLTAINLTGICLIDQKDLYTWSLALPVDRVHIRGFLWKIISFILNHGNGIQDSPHCNSLVLEELPFDSCDGFMCHYEIPAIDFGHMMLYVRGCSFLTYQSICQQLTGNLVWNFREYSHWRTMGLYNPRRKLLPKHYGNIVWVLATILVLYLVSGSHQHGPVRTLDLQPKQPPSPAKRVSSTVRLDHSWKMSSIYQSKHKKARLMEPRTATMTFDHPRTANPAAQTQGSSTQTMTPSTRSSSSRRWL